MNMQTPKRIIDVAGAVVVLVITIPALVILAILIRLRSPGPAMYRQRRVGRHGVAFTMLKLRTMYENPSEILAQHLAGSANARSEWQRYGRLRNDPRVVSGIGHWLRRTSLDELPQLWNVIRGDMSLVGPRPLEPMWREQFARDEWNARLRVRPGVTGLWQISGRSDTDLAALLRLDSAYLQHWSLWTDIVILLRTPAAVISGRGAY